MTLEEIVREIYTWPARCSPLSERLLAVAVAAKEYFTEDEEQGSTWNPKYFPRYFVVKEALEELEKE